MAKTLRIKQKRSPKSKHGKMILHQELNLKGCRIVRKPFVSLNVTTKSLHLETSNLKKKRFWLIASSDSKAYVSERFNCLDAPRQSGS